MNIKTEIEECKADIIKSIHDSGIEETIECELLLFSERIKQQLREKLETAIKDMNKPFTKTKVIDLINTMVL